ncbi:MAG: hypothetical protein K1060chlam2_00576 [Chlamydiae bacterium]|nr:hypothetical protein [Chlamydiota bacterium]
MSKEIKKRQFRNYFIGLGLLIILIVAGVFFSTEDNIVKKTLIPANYTEAALPTEDPAFSNDRVRLSFVENQADYLQEHVKRLERSLKQFAEDKTLLEKKNEDLQKDTRLLQADLTIIKTARAEEEGAKNEIITPGVIPNEIKTWGKKSSLTTRNVSYEIPAGTVVKCLLVSSADCGVGVNVASDPHTVLLQPLANGKLPRNVQVALKGSRIIGTAIGDIASERVRIRVERLTLMVGKGGDFIETSIAGFVSGEDGKEGLRGIVVDRSGSIITRAAFASFMQGIGQSIQATLNNQTIEKISKVGDTQSILDVDAFRNAGFQGSSTALNKLAEYYIKRAEQLQPVIQIQAGRIVDVIFLKSVRIGEHNIKKQIEAERRSRGLS